MGTTAEKLSYLNTTKTKIKEALNLGGANITNETFRQYADKIKDRYLYYMLNGTQVVWNNWNKVSGTGTSLTLNNTEEAPISLTYKGNTSQSGTPTPSSPIPVQVVSGDNTINLCGKNLFNDEFEQGTFDSNGINTSGVSRIRTKNYTKVEPETTYTMSYINNTGATPQISISYYSTNDFTTSRLSFLSWSTSNPVTFTTPANCNYIRFLFATTNGITMQPTYIKNVMLVKGNQTTTYEEYKGASYPINLGVENLWNNDIQTFTNQSRMNKIIKNDNGVWMFEITQSDGYSFAHSTFTLPAGTYTVTADVDNGDFLILKGSATQTIPFTLTEETQLTFRVYKNGVVGDVITLSNVKIAKGNSTDSVRKNPIELCKIGTYQDKIFKNTPNTTDYDSNLEDNVWYLKKEIGKVVLNGSENWSNFTTLSGGTISQVRLLNTNSGTREGLSNRFKVEANYNATEHIVFGGDNTTLYIHIANSRLTTLDIAGFETWLSNNNTTLYYILKTPTYETITDTTLLSQLEALKKSYEGQTNISQVNNDLPFELNVTALEVMN